MSSESAPNALRSSRAADRPRGHTGTSETELVIFAATERLLTEVPLHDISVADIIEQAKVARATFYFYFSSKYAVVAGLLVQIMDEIYDVVEPFRARSADEPPDVALRRSL